MELKKNYRHQFTIDNDADVKRLFFENADTIINYIIDKVVDFKKETTLDDIVDKTNILGNYEFTKDSDFIVKYTKGTDSRLCRIYVFRRIDVSDETIFEYCPYCNDEVELSSELKVQVCPNCGMAIVPCSICPLVQKGKCTSNCPLEEHSKILNREL